ncbi:alpha/beta hydrolase [Georgenia sp. AZ-5]|uniref:alpha/beta hydrolase n=1 Tax=Georgenia sp. AZ-5 TaxID=3367526 RepID=UPI0037540695
MTDGPSQPAVERWGAPLNTATTAVLVMHGIGQGADDMRALTRRVADHRAAYFAPISPSGSWYPGALTDDLDANRPELDDALLAVEAALTKITRSGFAPARTVLLGFSQGASVLAHHIVASPALTYAGAVLLAGGYLGPAGTRPPVEGRWDGRPVLVSVAEADPHVPMRRVEETADALWLRGADVELQVCAGDAHAIHDEQVVATRQLLARVRGDIAA